MAPVIQLRDVRPRVIGHCRGVLKRAIVFRIGGDARGAERVVTCRRADAGSVELRVQVCLERTATRHLVPIANFLAQPHAQAPLLHVNLLDPHRERRTEPRERKALSAQSARDR